MNIESFKAEAQVSVLDAAACPPAFVVYERLILETDAEGGVLIESAATGGRNGGQSVLLPEPVVRLTVRDAKAFHRALSPRGTPDSCIVIRSMRYHGSGLYHTRAGAGIAADSDPESELEETNHKAGACLGAVAAAELGP